MRRSTTKQRILPIQVHRIANKILRQYQIDGQPWFMLYDVVRLIDASRNATQIARTLPVGTTRKVQVTARPPTNMVSAHGLRHLIDASPDWSTKGTRAHAVARWADEHIRVGPSQKAEEIAEKIVALQGQIKSGNARLAAKTERLEILMARLNGITPGRGDLKKASPA